MSRNGSGARQTILVATATVIVVGVGAVVLLRAHEPPKLAVAQAPVQQPSLYCDFYDFTRARVVVSFDFAVDGMPTHARFAERAIVEPDGTRTEFDAGSQPVWTYAVDEGTPTIASPVDETRIVLYGLQPTKGGFFWTEAGLRSNRYRNLEGKCRQAYLAIAPRAKGDTP